MSWDEYFLGRNPNVLSGIYGKPNDFDHAAEVEKLEGELVEQARLLGMGGEREAKLMADVARLQERVRVLEAQASITDRLFLRVLSQALGEDDNRELRHLFMSAYEQACEWVERKGYGGCTDTGARLKADPFDVEVSWNEMDALAQPQPCKTCGGTGSIQTIHVFSAGGHTETSAEATPCPDCKPQQKEGKP